jgi:AcrR family transcriptional regulator
VDAASGVLNSVLMVTRERVHDLGVFKAIGMTPRQTIAMVVCWVVVPAIGAALIALPAGMILQNVIVHAIGGIAGIGIPGRFVHVYGGAELLLLALAGLAIAAVGAVGPASWAAASKTTAALHTEQPAPPTAPGATGRRRTTTTRNAFKDHPKEDATPPSTSPPPRPDRVQSPGSKSAGLRERKKARTRAEIQHQALRLFREQGYEATTTSQIAAAAEISESTFFRYFPAKEDVITWDPFDLQLIAAFCAQPPGLTPITALRAAFRQIMTRLSPAEWAQQRRRVQLLLTAPPLRARLMDSGIRQPMRLIIDAIAERTGQQPSHPAVRALSGAVIGVSLAALFAWAEDPDTDIVALFDELMAQLEAGLPSA